MQKKLLTFEFHGLTKVISGGQVGADRGALEAARDVGVETGGLAPRGWRTEFGPAPDLADFGLVEHYSPEYRFRTEQNAVQSDGTLIIASNLQSPGTSLTIAVCSKHKKPFLAIKLPHKEEHITQVVNFVRDNGISVLNVAGNRDAKGNSKHHDAAFYIVTRVLNDLKNK